MIIKCPKCKSSYEIEKSLILQNGRKVKCFKCPSIWIQYINGKVKELESEDTFSSELEIRKNLIRNSLNSKNINIDNTENKNNLLTNDQERELLSSLAISEIVQNKVSDFKTSYDDTNPINRVETNRDKLKLKNIKNSFQMEKEINKSRLGFILVSIFFVSLFIFYEKPEMFIGKNTKYEEELKTIVSFLNIIITNLMDLIEKTIIELKKLL